MVILNRKATAVLLTNDVPEEQQCAVLLSGCGPTTYQLIRNLTAPAKPTAKSFADLVALVKEHKNPRPSVIVRRYAGMLCPNLAKTRALYVFHVMNFITTELRGLVMCQ